ncbi:hypothetical protein L0F63_002137 [Massospora cicadina]|nr:hypothetical protein L0F63_002137 [Massospora cicadina]
MATPWLQKETPVYLEPHQRCQDFFVGEQRESLRSHAQWDRGLSKDRGRLFFFSDNQQAICGTQHLGVSANYFLGILFPHPLGCLLRVRFDSTILSSVDVYDLGGSEAVCWVSLASRQLVRLQLDANLDFALPGRPLLHQQFGVQGIDSDLTLFKALDARSVVMATERGMLYYGEFVAPSCAFACKMWTQPSLMSSLLSPLSRLFRADEFAEMARYQTVALASYPLGDGTHLVFSLCRDRVVRIWSTRTHQQIHSFPLTNLDLSGSAIAHPPQLLPATPVDAIRVCSGSLDAIRLVVYSLTSDLVRWLPYRETPGPCEMVDFIVTSDATVDVVWAIWDRAGQHSIAYLPHNFAGGPIPSSPFPYDCGRWLPVAPDDPEAPPLPQLPPTSSSDEITGAFLEFLAQPQQFALRAIQCAAEVHFRGKPADLYRPKTGESPQALFAFLQKYMGGSLDKDGTYCPRLVEEWTHFTALCAEAKAKVHRPVSLSVYQGAVITVYGDSLGVLRQCDPLEALADCVAGRLPRSLEGVCLAPLVGAGVRSLDKLIQAARLVELFQLAGRLWESPALSIVSQKVSAMIRDPDSSSALSLAAQAIRDVLVSISEVARLAADAHLSFDLLRRVHSLLDPTLDAAFEFPQAGEASGWFLHDAMVGAALAQLVRCRTKLARDLLLVYLAATLKSGLEGSRARECFDGVEAMWRWFGIHTHLSTLFQPLPIREDAVPQVRCATLALDVTLTEFYSHHGSHVVEHPSLQTPPYYWFSLFQGFARTVAKPADLLSRGLTAFSRLLLGHLAPDASETNRLFFSLLTWLEIKGQCDLALHLVRYVQCVPVKKFLTGKLLLARGQFDAAYGYLSSAADDGGPAAYLAHLASWFQAYGAYEGALLFCHRALAALPAWQENLDARNRMWKMSFELALAHKKYPEAYYAFLNLSGEGIQAEALRVLVVTMGSEGRVDELCRFPFPGLEGTFVTVLWDLILALGDFGSLSVNYFHVLAAFYLVRRDFRNVASTQYHYLLWLTAQTGLAPEVLPAWLDQLVSAAQFGAANLSLVPEASAWVATRSEFLPEREVRFERTANPAAALPLLGNATGKFAESTERPAPVEVVTEDMLLRVHALLVVQRDLPSTFPPYQLIRAPKDPQEVVESLLSCQAFPQALRVSLRFQLSLSPVFRALTEACLKVPDLKGMFFSESNPWSLLKAGLDQFSAVHSSGPGEYELVALAAFLAAGGGDALPEWLYNRACVSEASRINLAGQDLNLMGVIGLLLQHADVSRCADLATGYLQQLLEQDHPATPTTFYQVFPVEVIGDLVVALKLSKDEAQLPLLQKLLARYLERAQADSDALLDKSPPETPGAQLEQAQADTDPGEVAV